MILGRQKSEGRSEKAEGRSQKVHTKQLRKGRWILDARNWMLDFVIWILGAGIWNLSPNYCICRNYLLSCSSVINLSFYRNFSREFSISHSFLTLPKHNTMLVLCWYYFGTSPVCKCPVIARLLLRNWCVFDNGNFSVVRGSFAAFCSPVGKTGKETLCIV